MLCPFSTSTGKMKAEGPSIMSEIVLKMNLVIHWKKYWKDDLVC